MTPRRSDESLTAADTFDDPYDAMSDEEFSSFAARLFDEPSGPTRSVTVRMPEDLLTRLQHLAATRHMPYQRLMKRILEESVAGLERREAAMPRTAVRKTRRAGNRSTSRSAPR